MGVLRLSFTHLNIQICTKQAVFNLILTLTNKINNKIVLYGTCRKNWLHDMSGSHKVRRLWFNTGCEPGMNDLGEVGPLNVILSHFMLQMLPNSSCQHLVIH